MTTGGFVFMALSWAVIIGLNLFCFYRLSNGSASNDSRDD